MRGLVEETTGSNGESWYGRSWDRGGDREERDPHYRPTKRPLLLYVDDLVEGVVRLMGSSEVRPVNVGNPVEYTV